MMILFQCCSAPSWLACPSSKPTRPAFRSATSLNGSPVQPCPARKMVIDFGDHMGKTLESIPVDYLSWMATGEAGWRWAMLAEEVLHLLAADTPSAQHHQTYGRCLNNIICQLGPETDAATYASLLRLCTLENEAERLHELMITSGYADNTFLNNLLVQLYSKCGCLQHASAVFDSMTHRNIYSWTIMLTAFAQNGHGNEALQVFDQMQAEGFHPDKVTSICVLDACASSKALHQGREIHAIAVDNGWESDLVVGTALVNMYGKCGSLDDARAVFAGMPCRNVISWNAVITACVKNGHGDMALELFSQMQTEGFKPNRITFICILDACASITTIEEIQNIHANIVGNGWESEVVVGTALVNIYGKCGCLDDAKAVFAEMPLQNVISWNAMIAMYAQNGHSIEALQLFDQMQAQSFEPNCVTSICILDACGRLEARDKGLEIHAIIVGNGWESDIVLGTALISMHSKCGSLDDARAVFAEMTQHDVILWNAMIAACAHNEHGEEALQLFSQMQTKGFKPSKITLISVLDACASVAALEEGQEVHASVVGNGWDSDVIVGNALINMYGKCQSLDDAGTVFAQMPQWDVVSWSAMIAVTIQNGHGKEALQLLGQMQAQGFKQDKVTSMCTLGACASVAALEEGRQIHASIVANGWECDVALGTALVDMYGKCGHLNDARAVFAEMAQQGLTFWNAMIGACAQNGNGKEALQLLTEMQAKGFQPNRITALCILDGCASVTVLEEGREMHASIVGNGWEADVMVGAALVNMYGKCGSLDDARAVFMEMPQRDVVSWNVMIAACAQNGHDKEALHLFGHMQTEGFKPDEITFVSVLTACSHMGLVADGRQNFDSMSQDHGITPLLEHYLCMIDILGRAGQLEMAEQLINSMPFQPVASAWLSLLSSCRIHDNLEQGIRAANFVFDLEERNDSLYVMLANIHAAAGKWDGADKLRKAKMNNGMKELPVCSFIKANYVEHEFDTGDPAWLNVGAGIC